jgi:hypothetical protein
VGFAGLWIYVVTHPEQLGTGAQPRSLWQSIPRFTGGLAVYVAGTLVAAFWSAAVALAVFGLIAVYYLFDHLPTPGEPGAPSEAA